MILYLQEVGIIMKPILFSIGLGSIFLLLACDYKNISNSNPQSSDLLHQEIQNYKKINKEETIKKKKNSFILLLKKKGIYYAIDQFKSFEFKNITIKNKKGSIYLNKNNLLDIG